MILLQWWSTGSNRPCRLAAFCRRKLMSSSEQRTLAHRPWSFQQPDSAETNTSVTEHGAGTCNAECLEPSFPERAASGASSAPACDMEARRPARMAFKAKRLEAAAAAAAAACQRL